MNEQEMGTIFMSDFTSHQYPDDLLKEFDIYDGEFVSDQTIAKLETEMLIRRRGLPLRGSGSFSDE